MSAHISVSADIGGTFTDIVTVDDRDGSVVVGKSQTVPEDPTAGVIEGLESTGLSLAEASRFMHGTTIGINTLLERKGASVGFITTAGFRDVLSIGTGSWPPYRLAWEKPTPLVARRRCREVCERIRVDGTIEQALDTEELLEQVGELLEEGVDALAVCFYNAYANPDHERIAGEVIRRHHPGTIVALSHELTRRYREVDRAVTTSAEAYLRPRMRRYFERLTGGLDDAGFVGQLFITSSDGGVMGGEVARNRALRTLVSGCASGVCGAAFVAARSGWSDVLAIDMGGTSFDAAAIQGGEPVIVQSSELAGLRFVLPMIDLATIGAGGGSIASVDVAGGLNVGPQSAGAVPGPACYGRGGTSPTFSDAALVAGLLPETLLSGGMGLRTDLARAALETDIAGPLGLSVEEAAMGIITIIETRMAQTLEELTLGRGLDPRSFTIMAYGGGGPLVGAELASRLGVKQIVVPMHPGVFSALGMQTLDIVHEFSQTQISALSETSPDTVTAAFAELCESAAAALRAEGVEDELMQLLRSTEMRYADQEHTLSVPFGAAGGDLAELRSAFDEQHEASFGFTIEGEVEIVGYRVRAIGLLPKAKMPARTTGRGDPSAALRGSRTVHRRGSTPSEWPVYRRDLLMTGDTMAGPAIIEELTATTVVTSEFSVRVDPHGDLVLSALDGGEDG